jgi:hypothetical protein
VVLAALEAVDQVKIQVAASVTQGLQILVAAAAALVVKVAALRGALVDQAL